MKPRDIGVEVQPPTHEWDGDPHDPFYGTLPVRGQLLQGIVVRARAQRTAHSEGGSPPSSQRYELG